MKLLAFNRQKIAKLINYVYGTSWYITVGVITWVEANGAEDNVESNNIKCIK